jgi:hypothetical protein
MTKIRHPERSACPPTLCGGKDLYESDSSLRSE